MTDRLRRCGHPLGDTRWCPDCALAEERNRGRLPEPAAAPAAGELIREVLGKLRRELEITSCHVAKDRLFELVDEAERALAAATPSVPQTHPGETDTYIDSVVQAADAHGRMRNPATQRSLDGAKIDLGRHLRQIASSSKTAPPVQVEDDVLQRAADMLTAYAELVKATGQFAEQHYIPEVEYVVSELQAARGQSEHG
jgi:hypothetical protein